MTGIDNGTNDYKLKTNSDLVPDPVADKPISHLMIIHHLFIIQLDQLGMLFISPLPIYALGGKYASVSQLHSPTAIQLADAKWHWLSQKYVLQSY